MSSNTDQLTGNVNDAYHVLERLRKEFEATRNLIDEGDPFLMNRQEYYEILYWIITGKSYHDQ